MGRAQTHALFDSWSEFSGSKYAVALIFAWAFCEAIFWPVVPDFILILMIVGSPRRFWPLLAGAILGSAVGGMLIYVFAYLEPARAHALAPLLPLANDSMIRRASAILAEQGLVAFLIQPVSGISYRFYALLAGSYGFNPLVVALVSSCARGFRMLVASGIFALFALRFPAFVRDYRAVLLPICLVAFAVIWFATQIMS